MEYIKFWKEPFSDVRERKRIEKTTPSHSQHRCDLTRVQQILLFMLRLFFMLPAGTLHFLPPAYTVINGWKTTSQRVAASTT